MINSKPCCRFFAFLAMFFVLMGQAFAQNANYIGASGAAADGYDVVAYFTLMKPVVGDATMVAQHNGATYRFSSRENLDAFTANPEKYAPQYGGHCAFAASFGKKAPGDPNQWKVVDGKLYLNVNANVQKKWDADVPGFIARADEQWPKVK